jgi:YesN/AraC family two-component response regulator
MKRAIIIDDESMCIDLVEGLIKRYNMPIDIVGTGTSGEEALELAKALRPDLIYLDIELPDFTGIDVMTTLKEFLDYDPDIIVITAYDSFEYAQSVFRLGAKDILLKPVDYKKFFETMERVLGFKYTDNATFNDILEYIHSHYKEHVDLDFLCEKFHLSKSHVSRLFNQHLSTTFVNYRNTLRVEDAKELLKSSSLTIQQISESVGFESMHYFYRVFRKLTGKTPKSYQVK